MGTITEKLNKLVDTKNNIKAAIIEKGQTVGDVFSTYPDKIRAIEVASTPDISVSSSGLITAASGSKSSTKQLTTMAGKTVTPTTYDFTLVPSGTYAIGDINVAGDANLISANIKSGVNIFGVTGSAATINYTECSCKINNRTGDDIYVHYQEGTFDNWSSVYVSAGESSVIRMFVGAWAYCQLDGTYIYIRASGGAAQVGPGESAAFYIRSSSTCSVTVY